MGATKIMVIRHAEKPGSYNGAQYAGVNNLGTVAGDDGTKHLVTLGWERAGALVTLFAAPWGPKTPSLATPQFLFASDPIFKHDDDTSDEGPSQRPYETLTALAAKLSLTIDASHGKNQHRARYSPRRLWLRRSELQTHHQSPPAPGNGAVWSPHYAS